MRKVLACLLCGLIILAACGVAYADYDTAKQQIYLKYYGYYTQSVDGSVGNGTRSAFKAFQSDNGLEETGEADEATLEKLYDPERAQTAFDFELRNGIKWGMTIDQVDEALSAEGIGTHNDVEGKTWLKLIGYKKVPVSTRKVYATGAVFGEFGLQWMIYHLVPNSPLVGTTFIEDYDDFRALLGKKYGEPTNEYSEWDNPYLSEVYDLEHGAKLGHYTSYAQWETEDTVIELNLGKDLESYGIAEGVAVSISYYSKFSLEALDIMKSKNNDVVEAIYDCMGYVEKEIDESALNGL